MSERVAVYDTRALTDEQRSLADDIASAMDFGHEDSCAVWWEDPDGCSCPLLQAVADGLEGARVVEIVSEMGYDSTTRRGDRLVRHSFQPHPLTLPPEAMEWARELMSQGYRDEHIVTFTEDGYGLEHPIRCRPNLIGCVLNEWLATQPAPDREPGRYIMDWYDGPQYTPLSGVASESDQ